MIIQNTKLDTILRLVHSEVVRASAKFGTIASAHEGASIVREEFDELWDEIKANKVAGSKERQMREAIQLAAMAVRFLHDLSTEDDLDAELYWRHQNPLVVHHGS